jgi:hypothetical protein
MKPLYEQMNPVRISCKSDAKKYIGKKIWFLRSEDIDKSGRGYYFPRFIIVDEIVGNDFHWEDGGFYVEYKKIVRLMVLPEELPKEKGADDEKQ